MDLDPTSTILNTPSLMTPDISTNPTLYKFSHETLTADAIINNDNTETNITPSSVIAQRNDEPPSTEIKLSKIKDDLKQSFTQPRKPTESLFQQLAKAGALTFENGPSLPSTQDDGVPIEIPSTAEVMSVIESFNKYSNQDNTERETATIISSDNSFLDTSTSQSMGVNMNVSPKKKLLYRSFSHTEPASPSSISINQVSQSQKTNLDDTNSTDDDQSSYGSNEFQRVNDALISTRPMNSNAHLETNTKLSYTIQLTSDHQNGVNSTVVKQQPVIKNNKRTFQQMITGGSAPKANANIISPITIKNEVSSTNQLIGIKRQKTNSTNTRSSTSSNNDNNNNNQGSDDERKKHIRDSNREAARRCRERRRNYIEQLEGNLEQCKSEIKQLNDKISHVEQENTQLRAIISEAKIFRVGTNISSNDSMTDFVNVIPSNSIDFNSESTDGNIIQRNYYTRSTH